jgi:hypothetical protein
MPGKSKIKKLNWGKCDKPFKEEFHGTCFNYCINRTCLISKEICMAYTNWDEKDGYLKK